MNKNIISNNTIQHKSMIKKKISKKNKLTRVKKTTKYSTKTKILKTYSNLKTFTQFYKNISSIEKQTIIGYKKFDYISINKYLYNHNNIKEFNIDELDFDVNIKSLYSNNTK